ncbi:YciI family protein [Natribacillus halophilus]|uniref:Uncharacterized conserved protein YciI, contains a putative active-site phosphohistidine n=1 Tax=Natribacillus halophilus TaxID=549003 RepID=A0A1G8PCJ5_9BACI|nr:YciI family protein [Natribacillus halophilus]SDI89460.1 Uncharacterized conserved protein YciI, contains a putative active-site phosphohistidine [Natribacillus halophilus]
MKSYVVFLKMLDPQKSEEYRQQHLDFLSQKRKEKKVFANGKFLDGSGGMVIYMANSEEEVRNMVTEDPLINEKARDFEIYEWEMVTNAIIPD